ncbi:TolC family protein [Pontiella sp.]|uniref:TolC family protein n=1 Tax=Pontiella sp. TaxID=2837462 RepID=UPI00356ABCCE
MKKRLLITVLATAGVSLAQTNALLTWEQCLAQTKAYNPALVSARAAVRELEYGVASATSSFLPQISAKASMSYGESEDSTGDWDEKKSSSGSLSLSQDLFSGGGNVAKRKRALAQLEIGIQQYRKSLSDVELQLRVAYIDVLYAQDLVALTEKIAKRRADNVRLIQLRFDGGRENAGSLARSKAQLSDARYEVREAERSLAYALRNLAAAIGTMEPPPGAKGDLQAAAPGEVGDLKPLMEQTPSYLIAATQVEAAKLGLKVTRSARFPSLSFSASTGLSSGDYDTYRGSWSAGLSTSVPLYTGNQLQSDIAAAKEGLIQNEMDLMDEGNSLMASLTQSWNNYVNAVESETVQKELLDAEQLRAEISTAKYKQGLLDYEDWDTIENTVINQGKSYLQARRTSETRQANWKNALGMSVWATEKGE